MHALPGSLRCVGRTSCGDCERDYYLYRITVSILTIRVVLVVANGDHLVGLKNARDGP